ncbi:MAG: chorismate synthase [Lentisphaeria bacterium]|nr:chorismate synthase [Lentisphaeria bacterium]
MNNSFGSAFRIMTSGESHGIALKVIIDGAPDGIPIDSCLYRGPQPPPNQSMISTAGKECNISKICNL